MSRCMNKEKNSSNKTHIVQLIIEPTLATLNTCKYPPPNLLKTILMNSNRMPAVIGITQLCLFKAFFKTLSYIKIYGILASFSIVKLRISIVNFLL